MVNVNKIKELAKEKGLKLQAVCDKIGASRYRFYDWERGKSSPSESDLEALAVILGTTVDYLTDKTEQKNKPLTEVRGYSLETIDVLNQIEQLNPANRAKLQELLRLFLADQDKKQ